MYVLDGYESIERHRPNNVLGGIGFIVKVGVNFKLRDDLTIFGNHCESLIIEIDKLEFGSGRDLPIAVIYRPTNADVKRFIDVLKDVLEKVQLENKLLYLVGDYNINLLILILTIWMLTSMTPWISSFDYPYDQGDRNFNHPDR